MHRDQSPARRAFLIAGLMLATSLSLAAPTAEGFATQTGTILPDIRTDASAVWDGRHVYLFGGGTLILGPSLQVLRYDPLEDRVEMMGPRLSAGRVGIAAAWTGEQILLMGGSWETASTDEVLAYDPSTDTLRTLPFVLPAPVTGAAAVWDGSHTWLFGGVKGSPPSATDEILRIDPTLGTVEIAPFRLAWPTANAAATLEGDTVWIVDAARGMARIDLGTGQVEAKAAIPDGTPTTSRLYLGGEGPQLHVVGVANEPRGVLTYNTATDIFAWETQVDPLDARARTRDVLTHAVRGPAVWADGALIVIGSLQWEPSPVQRWIPRPDIVDGSPLRFEATLPAALGKAASVAYGGYIYLFGGEDADGLRDEILRFDPATGQILTMGARLPAPRAGIGAAQVGDYAYLLGGCGASACYLDEILRYDPATDTLVTLPTRLMRGVTNAAVVSTGSSLYVFGGRTGPQTLSMTDEIQQYTPSNGSSVLNDRRLTLKVEGATAVWTGDVGYVFGGRNCYIFTDHQPTPQEACEDRAEIQAFRPSTSGPVTVVMNAPDVFYAAGSAWDGHYAYIVGGDSYHAHLPGCACTDVLRFEPATGTVAVVANLATATSWSAVEWSGSALYALGGVQHRNVPQIGLEASVSRYATPPPAPTQLVASGGDGAITLTWEPPTEASALPVLAYNIYRAWGAGAFVEQVPASVTSHTVAGLPGGVLRSYRVAAVSHAGEGPSTAIASATTAPSVPEAPGPLRALGIAPGAVLVSWSTPHDGGSPMTGYAIERTAADGAPEDLGPIAPAPALTRIHDLDANDGGFVSRSMDALAPIAWEPDIGAFRIAWDRTSPTSTPPSVLARATPFQLTPATNFEISARLTTPSDARAWFAAEPLVLAGEYDLTTMSRNRISILYRAGDGDPNNGPRFILDYLDSSGVSRIHLEKTVPAGGIYTVQVAYDAPTRELVLRVENDLGAEVARARASIAAPSTFAFDAYGLASGRYYATLWGERADGLVDDIAFTAQSDATFLDTDLAAGSDHAYRIRALNALGEGPPSRPVDGRAPTTPAAPSSLSVTTGPEGRQLALVWAAPSDNGGLPITSYQVHRDGLLVGAATSDLTYTDTGLESGVSYSYRIAAVNDVGAGGLSPAVSGTTFPLPGPVRALAAQAGPGAGEVTLSWTPPSDTGGLPIVAHRIYRSEDGTTWATRGQDGRQNASIDAGNPDGVALRYRIAAVTTAGEGPAVDLVSATTLALPTAPQGLAATPFGSGFALSWEPADAAERVGTWNLWRDGPAPGGATSLARTMGSAAFDFRASDHGFVKWNENAGSEVSWNAIDQRIDIDVLGQASDDEMLMLAMPAALTHRASFDIAARWRVENSTGTQGAYPLFLTGTPGMEPGATAGAVAFYYRGQQGSTGERYELLYIDETGQRRISKSFTPAAAEYEFRGRFDALTRTLTLSARTPQGTIVAAGSATLPPGEGLFLTHVGIGADGHSTTQRLRAWVDDVHITSAPEWLDAALPPGAEVTYTLSAVNPVGEGLRGDALPVTLPPGPATAPLDVTLVASIDGVQLDWSPPAHDGGSALEGYEIIRRAGEIIRDHDLTPDATRRSSSGDLIRYVVVDADALAGATSAQLWIHGRARGCGSAPHTLTVGWQPLSSGLDLCMIFPTDVAGWVSFDIPVSRLAGGPNVFSLMSAATSGYLEASVDTSVDRDRSAQGVGGNIVGEYMWYLELNGPTIGEGDDIVIAHPGPVQSFVDTTVFGERAYTYRVAARTAIGVGDASQPAYIRAAPRPPLTPVLDASSGVLGGSVDLSWRLEDPGDRPIDAWRISRSVDGENAEDHFSIPARVDAMHTFAASEEGFVRERLQDRSEVRWDATAQRVSVSVDRRDPADELFVRDLGVPLTPAQSFNVSARWATTAGGNWQAAYPLFLGASDSSRPWSPSGLLVRYSSLDQSGSPRYELIYQDESGVDRVNVHFTASKNVQYHFVLAYDAPTRVITLRILSSAGVELKSASYIVGTEPGDGFRFERVGVASDGLGAITGQEPVITAWTDDITIRRDLPFAYTDTGLVKGVTYSYRVSAVTGVGDGPTSASESAMATRTVPGSIDDTEARRSDALGEIDVTWSPPTDDGGMAISGYRIFSGLASGALTPIALLGPEARAFTQTDLPNGTLVWYRVVAVNELGDGLAGMPVSARTVSEPSAPRDPTLFAPIAGRIQVTWKAPEDDGGRPVGAYHLLRADRALMTLGVAPVWSLVATVPGDERTASDPSPPGWWTYMVVAVNEIGESPGSSQVSVVSGGTSPSA